MRVHQPVLDTEPQDLVHRKNQDPPAAVDRHLAHVDPAPVLEATEHRLEIGRRLCGRAPRAHPRHGLLDTRAREGLQQVIDRLHLEGADRILVVCRREHHVRRRRAERLQDLEAVHARHLHVEKHEIRSRLGDQLQRFHAVCRIADHVDVSELGEKPPQAVAGELVVVDEERANRRRCHHAAASTGRAGRRRRTRVPIPGALVISGRQAAP